VVGTAIVAVTGGLDSLFSPFYFLVVVHAAMLFGRRAVVLASLVTAGCFAGLLVFEGGGTTGAAAIVLRLGFIVITAVFAGLLSDRARSAERAVADQLAFMQALHAASSALTGTVEWSEVVQQVATQARLLVRADAAIVELDDSWSPTGVRERASDVVPKAAYLAKLLLQHDVLGSLPPSPPGKPVVLDPAAQSDTLPEQTRLLPTASVLRGTLGSQRRSIGDLLLVRVGNLEPFRTADVDVLEAFLQQATLALEGAQLYQRVHEQATTDPVTGLPNHRSLKERLYEEVTRARRYGRPLCVLMLDLDHFKAFNDTYGHAAGDMALRAVADALSAQTRHGDLVARYGGEEFVVALPETDAYAGAALAERLCAAVVKLAAMADHANQRALTVSIGLAAFPEHGGDLDMLLAAADRAMYTAKHEGRNQVCMAVEQTVSRDADELLAHR
jgi:diguanylate cyclase (GGDEF)-like protein